VPRRRLPRSRGEALSAQVANDTALLTATAALAAAGLLEPSGGVCHGGSMGSNEIATSAEIRAIFERATELLARLPGWVDDAGDDEDQDERVRSNNLSIYCATEALRFCAVAAAALREPGLGDIVVGVVDHLTDFESRAANHHRTAFEALSDLLAAGLRADKQVCGLAQSENAELREAVARGLRPLGDQERALLEQLASDPVAAVRKSAKKSLAGAAEVPWWNGKWKSDPAVRLLPGESASCGPALRRASELLELSSHALGNGDALAELVGELGKLPGELAVEAIEQVCRASERYQLKSLQPLVLHMLERAEGLAAFERLVEHWGRSDAGLHHRDALPKIALAAPSETRLALWQRLIALVTAAPIGERSAVSRSPAFLAGAIAGEIWPPEVDVSPVLDAVLALHDDSLGPYKHDYARRHVAAALVLPGVDPAPVLGRLVEARLAGYPGAWKGIGDVADALLARAPREVIRETAERALPSKDAPTLAWALGQLLGAAFDPALDGSPCERAGVLLAEPRLRAVILEHDRLVDRVLPVLRSELRRDLLSCAEAVETFEGIARLYGGLAVTSALEHARRTGEPAEALERSRREAQAKVSVFLGPPELAGPPTQAEWEALRRARAANEPAEVEERSSLWRRTLSEGPWTPQERAELETLMGHFRAGEVDALEYDLAAGIGSKPDLELLPLLDEIVARCNTDMRPLAKRYRADARKALGIAPPEKKATKHAQKAGAEADDLPGGAWNDDDDE
jgi:hypothetical protein